MQQRLRKFGQWLWLNKERMVFLIMVGVLCWRVYQVVFPVPPEDAPVYSTPSPNREMAVPQPEGVVFEPPAPPPPASPLLNANPFWYFAQQSEGGGAAGEDRVDVQLHGIMETPKGPVARIQAGAARAQPFQAGEKFMTFTVMDINVDAGEVEVYDESTGEQIILRRE